MSSGVAASSRRPSGVLKLNGDLAPGGAVMIPFLLLDPKGRYVLYVADEDTDDVREIYRSKLSNAAALKLNDPFVSGGDVTFN